MPAIKYKKKTYAGATFPVLELTKAEYDALPDAKKMDGTVYMITDDDGGWEAERSTYDNTASGLTATNVQSALDEIVDYSKSKVLNITNISSKITQIHTQIANQIGNVVIFHLYVNVGSTFDNSEQICKIKGAYPNPHSEVPMMGCGSGGVHSIWARRDGSSNDTVIVSGGVNPVMAGNYVFISGMYVSEQRE